MTGRLASAAVLVQHAKKLRNGIGEHGDPYEDSLLKGSVAPALTSIVTEILDKLRTALDHVAGEVAERCSVADKGRAASFPIAARGSTRGDFRGLLAEFVPGVIERRPDLAAILEGLQAFASANNEWLADLATLAAQGSSQLLSVAKRDASVATVRVSGGKPEVHILEAGVPTVPGGLTLIDSWPEGGNGPITTYCVRLESIDRDLLPFVDICIEGTGKVIEAIASHA